MNSSSIKFLCQDFSRLQCLAKCWCLDNANIIERLFSRAKRIVTAARRCMSPSIRGTALLALQSQSVDLVQCTLQVLSALGFMIQLLNFKNSNTDFVDAKPKALTFCEPQRLCLTWATRFEYLSNIFTINFLFILLVFPRKSWQKLFEMLHD